MKRRGPLRRTAGSRQALPRSEVAAVPTFEPDTSKDSAAPASKTPAEEAAEEAVRRMVEAAYT